MSAELKNLFINILFKGAFISEILVICLDRPASLTFSALKLSRSLKDSHLIYVGNYNKLRLLTASIQMYMRLILRQ